MRRRDFLATLGSAVLAPVAARSQPIPLIGVFDAASAAAIKPRHEAFGSGMQALGYFEGRNIRYAYRYGGGDLDRLPALAAELVALNPTIVVSAPVPANVAMKRVAGA